MKYCNDWDKIRSRHAAFWKGEREGACLCSVVSTRDDVGFEEIPIPKNNEDRIKWWTDPELIIKRNRSWFANTYYAGDAFPVLVHDLGPAGHAGFFKGVKSRFESSIWFEKMLENYEDLIFDPNSFLYKTTINNAREYVSDANGDYIVSMPDTVGDADVLSHLRGPDTLMFDFLDNPDEIRKALKTVQAVWEKTIQEMYDIVSQNNYGGTSIGWLQTWAPGKHGQLQCDLSVMLSPNMFEEFLLYELTAQSAFLDNALYHLDGQQQVMHLDHILSVKNIKAIQWTNVAGQPPVTSFIPVLKRIQESGKSLILDCSPEEIQELMENLSSSQMYIRTYGQSQSDADDIIKLVEKLSKD